MYSDWTTVPTETGIAITGPVENEKFQIKTDAAILTDRNDIRMRWTGVGFFWIIASGIGASKCGYSFTGNETFLSRGGVFTFHKNTTHLLVWFDEVLEVVWEYEDNSVDNVCYMRNELTGIEFHLAVMDTASREYRYTIIRKLTHSILN